MKKIFTTSIAVLSLTILMSIQSVAALASPITKRYVALGDSVAAGAGLPLKDNAPETQVCGRSDQAYPFGVGVALGVATEQLACGGASVKQGIIGPQTSHGLTFAAQIDQAYTSSAQMPTHISLTVGTNDIHWSEFIGKCYAATCGTWQDSLAAAQLQLGLFNDLQKAMEQIRHQHPQGSPLPKVVLSGYFQPLSSKQPVCADTQHLTKEEINWVRYEDEQLNTMIRSVASMYHFAKYAPVDFKGHELCSPTPWVQGLHDPAAYHPTARGQQAIAASVARAFQQ